MSRRRKTLVRRRRHKPHRLQECYFLTNPPSIPDFDIAFPDGTVIFVVK